MNFTRQAIPGNPALSCLYAEHPSSRIRLTLLHGVARCAEDFLELIPGLSSMASVRALDFRGHGQSAAAGENYRVVDYLQDVERLLQADAECTSTTPPAHFFFGHSLGAMVALAAAAAWPTRVHGLILEDPPFHTMGRDIRQTSWLPLFQNMREIAANGGSTADIQLKVNGIRVPDSGGNWRRLDTIRSSESLAFSAQCLMHVDPRVFDPILAGAWLDQYDLLSLLKKVKCPTLVFRGDAQAGATLATPDAEVLQRELSNCNIIWLEGCGHLIHRERPGEVLSRIRRFLQEWNFDPSPSAASGSARPHFSNKPSQSSTFPPHPNP